MTQFANRQYGIVERGKVFRFNCGSTPQLGMAPRSLCAKKLTHINAISKLNKRFKKLSSKSILFPCCNTLGKQLPHMSNFYISKVLR